MAGMPYHLEKGPIFSTIEALYNDHAVQMWIVYVRDFDGLTSEQHEVVVHEHGPLVVFAGPGAGKTKTICSRAAYLVASGRALSEQILCVTFTNRAAGEMRERLNLMLGDLAAGITVQSRRGLILPTGLLTIIGVAVSAVLTRGPGVGTVTATGIAAVAVGVLGRLLAQRMDAPSLVLVVPASFGLLPGLTIFRGLYELVAQGENSGLLTFQSGLSTLLSAGGVLLAIATGTVLGEYLAAPWDRHVRGSRRPRTHQVPR